MLGEAGVVYAYTKEMYILTSFSAVCACSHKYSGVNYTVQGAYVFSSASLLQSFSTNSLMSYSQSCQKAWSACHLGNERCLCSERLVYTLESGHLLFIHLGPSSALYVHLILNTFVSGKEENALAWQQSPWTTHWATCTSCTSPLHLYQSSLACGEREWLPSFPFSSENVLILLPLMRFLSIVVYSILELLESRSVRVV